MLDMNGVSMIRTAQLCTEDHRRSKPLSCSLTLLSMRTVRSGWQCLNAGYEWSEHDQDSMQLCTEDHRRSPNVKPMTKPDSSLGWIMSHGTVT